MSEQPTPAPSAPADAQPTISAPSAPSAPADAQPQPPTPPGPPVGPYDPANVWAVPPFLAPPVRRDRAAVRTVLRWSTAAVLCLAVGVGTAFAVLAPRRTDLPGLRTPGDGRYAFPALKLPALPPKASTPAQGKAVNGDPDHAANLTGLLLPAPLGAKSDPSPSSDPGGWYPLSSYLADMGNSTQLGSDFNEFGLRHITARAWTGADGVRTVVYLLGFRTDSDASAVYLDDLSGTRPTAGTLLDTDPSATFPGLLDITRATSLSQNSSQGRSAMRVAFMTTGDVEAVVVMSDARAVPLVNFQQVVALQGELLQG
jgi:hypothetical protein